MLRTIPEHPFVQVAVQQPTTINLEAADVHDNHELSLRGTLAVPVNVRTINLTKLSKSIDKVGSTTQE